MQATETCTKCGESKPRSAFKPYKRKRNGLSSWCRACEHADNMLWRARNRERHLAYGARFRVENRELCRRLTAEWRARHPEKAKRATERWRAANPEKVLAYSRASDARRRANARDRLARSMSSAIRKALSRAKRGYSWESLVGYTLDDLMAHLERQFAPGMTWENRGAWHIDHVRPLASFDFATPDESAFKQCWALANLQPLWAADNIRKGARLQ